MPDMIKKEFAIKYPGLINKLKAFLEQDTSDKAKLTPFNKVLQNADDWWNDV